MAGRDAIVDYCDGLLETGLYQDVAVNGLQVEGAEQIERLAVAVSTSRRTLAAAAEWGAQALLVHHGLLWGSRLEPLTGLFADRLRILFQHDLNLIAYHLPLDGHPEIGNNALLAGATGYSVTARFAEVNGRPLGVVGERTPGLSVQLLHETLEAELDRPPTVVGAVGSDALLERVGFLSGSGYSAIAEAREAGCQALVTGDLREPSMAEARELGLVVIAAGHEATERFGVMALAAELQSTFSIETRFFPDPNPI
jgi:dinuclear metal center YbgI/SA1388 family protein